MPYAAHCLCPAEGGCLRFGPLQDMLSMDEFYVYYYSKLCFKFPVLR